MRKLVISLCSTYYPPSLSIIATMNGTGLWIHIYGGAYMDLDKLINGQLEVEQLDLPDS